MSLASRILDYEELCSRFICERPSNLIATHQIEEKLWQKLKIATAVYMSRCLPENQIILDERHLIEKFEQAQSEIKNITPNGMIVPKRHTILEYNTLVRVFTEVVDSLGITDLILSWHVPLNLRIKFGKTNKENLKRHHPTEHIHSDSWAGESAESVTTHIPIFGDSHRNHLVCYDPPKEFQEDWLRPLPSYKAGTEIAEKYTKLDFKPQKGQLVLADFASLHASSRLPGSGARVSIDTTFHLKRRQSKDKKETIHPWRIEERATHDVLLGLGQTHLFFFADDINQIVDSRGGFKHPTNLKILELETNKKN